MDFSSLSTALTTNVNGAVTAALPIAALVLGITVGYRVYKHFTK